MFSRCVKNSVKKIKIEKNDKKNKKLLTKAKKETIIRDQEQERLRKRVSERSFWKWSITTEYKNEIKVYSKKEHKRDMQE